MLLEPAADPQHDLDASRRIAGRVFDLAESLRLPLNPKVFRVLFEAESGPEVVLRKLREGLERHGSQPDVMAIETLHDQLFQVQGEQRGLASIGDRLMGEIRSVGSIVKSRIGQDASYISALTRTRSNMGLFTRAADVRKAIDEIVEESRGHAERVAEFVTEIDDKQRQIGELQAELRELRDRVNLDHLTGLFNRRYFDHALGTAIDLARESGTPLAVALGDIDHFKRLNDRWGHAVGDSVLRHFGVLMRNNVKGKDTAARYGGEEFALIFPETPVRGARTVVETIRQVFYSRSFVNTATQERIGQLSVSFGVTELREDDDEQSLLARVDALLYEAKARGRNNVASDPLHGAAAGPAAAPAPASPAATRGRDVSL